ncbi:sulfatase family protein [Thiolapillus sp.]
MPITSNAFHFRIIAASLLLLLLQGCTQESPSDTSRPNIVLVVSDQQHYQAFGAIDSFFSTPSLDELASESTLFTQAFVTSPQCSPSRSSLYTGYYPHKTRVIGNTGSIDAAGQRITRLDDSFRTIGEYLKPAGYVTAYIGKWHLGKPGKHAQGYDTRVFSTVKGGDSIPDRQKTRHALAFIDAMSSNPSKRPFALFLNYTAPHTIYEYGLKTPPEPIAALETNVHLPKSFYAEDNSQKPKSQTLYMKSDTGKLFYGKGEDIWKTYRGVYRKKVQDFDRELGKILDSLKTHDLMKNTLVIVTSDHGDMDTYHRLVFKGPFGYEQVIRVPLVVHVPKQFGGKTTYRENTFTVNVDLLPTILDFAGLPAGVGDGHSLKPLLIGNSNKKTRTEVVGEYYNKQKWVHPLRILRTDKYKYIDHLIGMDELYDLESDPQEIHNLIGDSNHTRIRKKLAERLNNWIVKQSDPFSTLSATDLKGRPLSPSVP